MFSSDLRFAFLRAVSSKPRANRPTCVYDSEVEFDEIWKAALELDSMTSQSAADLVTKTHLVDPRTLLFAMWDVCQTLQAPIDETQRRLGQELKAKLTEEGHYDRVHMGWGDFYKGTSKAEAVHQAARGAFMEALTRATPHVVRSLFDNVYPCLAQACRSSQNARVGAFSAKFALQGFPGLADPGFAPAVAALQVWAQTYNLDVDWIKEDVLESLYWHWSWYGRARRTKKAIEAENEIANLEWHSTSLMRSADFEKSRIGFALAGWDPSQETWQWFEARLDAYKRRYRARLVERAKQLGYQELTGWRKEIHFDFLVERIVLNLTWRQLGKKHDWNPYGVRDSVEQTAELVGINLPRKPGGRPPKQKPDY